MANLEKIRTIAKAKGLTLKYIARELDITEAAVHKMIKTNSTKIETLEKIAEILGVPISIFFNESDQIIKELMDRGFKKTFDETHSFFASQSPEIDVLYYKEIKNKGKPLTIKGSPLRFFIVFNNWILNLPEDHSGFDSWICLYNNEKQIGNTEPNAIFSLRLSFKLDHLHIINHIIG